MSKIYKILTHSEWEAANKLGHVKTELDDRDGFIHCSTAKQLALTLHFYFKKEKIVIKDQGFGKAEITFRHGGSGEPLLLLHGNPMSHVTWHKIVEDLKNNFYIVASDLRGYGEREIYSL